MPKMKTNRGAAKRFKFTGSGKVKRSKAHLRHILTKKAPPLRLAGPPGAHGPRPGGVAQAPGGGYSPPPPLTGGP